MEVRGLQNCYLFYGISPANRNIWEKIMKLPLYSVQAWKYPHIDIYSYVDIDSM